MGGVGTLNGGVGTLSGGVGSLSGGVAKAPKSSHTEAGGPYTEHTEAAGREGTSVGVSRSNGRGGLSNGGCDPAMTSNDPHASVGVSRSRQRAWASWYRYNIRAREGLGSGAAWTAPRRQ